MRLIDADVLYRHLQDAEELARNRVLDTESWLPVPTNLNLSYTRYSTQLDERTRLKYMVADAPTINPQPHWIPCSERLPEKDNVEVLCTVRQQNKTDHSETIIVEQGCYFYGTWLLSYDYQRVNCSREVLAWQPLPSPYQEEGEEE